jgi:hypothetical protein
MFANERRLTPLRLIPQSYHEKRTPVGRPLNTCVIRINRTTCRIRRIAARWDC